MLDDRTITNRLICPKSRVYPTFDAFLCLNGEWWPLQVTGDKNKTLSAEQLLKFFNAHTNIPRRWIGIVRPSMALRNHRFAVTEKKSSASKALLKKEMKQFVVPFPLLDDDLSAFIPADAEALVKMRIQIFRHHCNQKVASTASDAP